MKLSFLFIVCIVSGSLYSQSQKTFFLEKKGQHSISAEYAACSYSYAHRFKKNVTFGIRAQMGLGLPLLLVSSPTYVDFGYGNGPEKITPSGSSYEVLKMQLFYRYPMSKSFYFDIGPVASLCLGGEAEWEQPYRVGMEVSVYYTKNRFKVGVRIDGSYDFGINQQHPGITYETSYYALYLTPFVIGINF